MGTDTTLAKTKQELLTQRMLPKVEPMQTSKRKLMPVLSLLFHTQLLRPSSASLYHSNLDAKAEDSKSPEIEGEEFNLSSHMGISGQLQITATVNSF